MERSYLLTVGTAVSERRATNVASPTQAAGLIGVIVEVGVLIGEVGSAPRAVAVRAAAVWVVQGES
jgi:hypothetical protein